MRIDVEKVGYLNENCYILINKDEAIIIDPGAEYQKIRKKLNNLNVKAVLITHRHFDHVGALSDLLKEYNVTVFEFDNLQEKEYILGSFRFIPIFTPGHSKDSVTYYFPEDKLMFVGDFIFKNGIGRCDLKGGNFDEMKNSIKKIMMYDDCILYPGHGVETTLKDEKKNNPYFN